MPPEVKENKAFANWFRESDRCNPARSCALLRRIPIRFNRADLRSYARETLRA